MEKAVTASYQTSIISRTPIHDRTQIPAFCINPLAYALGEILETTNGTIFNQFHNTDNFKIAAYQHMLTKALPTTLIMKEGVLLIAICTNGKNRILENEYSKLAPQRNALFQEDQVAMSYKAPQKMDVISQLGYTDTLLIKVRNEHLAKYGHKYRMIYGLVQRQKKNHIASRYFPILKLNKELFAITEDIRNCTRENEKELNDELDRLIHLFLTTAEKQLHKNRITSRALDLNYFIEVNFMDPNKVYGIALLAEFGGPMRKLERNYQSFFPTTFRIDIRKLLREEALHQLCIDNHHHIDIAQNFKNNYNHNLLRDFRNHFQITTYEAKEILLILNELRSNKKDK